MPPLKAIALTGQVEITAAKAEGDAPAGPAKFDVLAYTGAAMTVEGYDQPVVVELGGMTFGKNLVANLDHDRTRRVGHVTGKSKKDGQLRLSGLASASTAARDEVVASARDGFVWQASIEASPTKIVELAAGKSVEVNGRTVEGPAYVVKKSVLKGFAFVSHGADDDTTVAIAASAKRKGTTMAKSKGMDFDAWVESIGFDPETLTEDQRTGLQANYAGNPTPKRAPAKLDDVFAQARADRERQTAIAAVAAEAIAERPHDVDVIEGLAEKAIEARWDADRFELEMHRASRPQSHAVFGRRSSPNGLTDKVIEAALCRTGQLSNLDKRFDEPTLDAAERLFPSGIGLRQLFLLCAQANGYRGNLGGEINLEVQRAAFGMTGDPRRPIHAAGFSTLSIPGILAATANKFLMEGWLAVDSTWRSITSIRSVRDFKTVTSYSLTGDFQYAKVGPGGEITHGTVGEQSYTNKADTYARMFAITRADIINDDLGALTAVPKRLGRGGALKLNDVFWTEFLNNSSFFHSDYNNVSTGAGSALGTADGAAINAAEVKFMNQTDPDGKPLGIMPKIMLVPPTLKNTAARWMGSQLFVGSTGLGDNNVFGGRYSIASSPYMENSSYTGYSAAAWYLLADPADMATIETCFLNGREAPTVETADAAFNVLGVEMRGYHDFGCAKQEKKAGVRSAGS